MRAPDDDDGDFAVHRARRAAATAQIAARTEIDAALIETLVRGFYARVAQDSMLGPIFAARIGDWEPHLAQMMRFWSSVALSTGVYQGRPMEKHLSLPITQAHFDHWLVVFEETARALCPPAAATHFIARAHTIAQSLAAGVARAHAAAAL